MKIEFLNLVLDIKGNISSTRLRKEYFIKQNKTYLWDWFETLLLKFDGYSKKDVILLLKENVTEIPKCIVCGNNAKVQSYNKSIIGVTYNYCSRKCSIKSIIRNQKLSNTKKNISNEEKEQINEKRKQTIFQKYGTEYNSQRLEIKKIIGDKLTKRYLSPSTIKKLNDINWLNNEYNIKQRTAVDIADELNVYYGTVIEYCKKYNFYIRKVYNVSTQENKISEFLLNWNIQHIKNDRIQIEPKELDIYIPEYKLAIEYNGLYYHSYGADEQYLDRYKLINKLMLCNNIGINLFHITSDQWLYKQDIIKSMILYKCGIFNESIYARKCIVKIINNKIANTFFNENHIQGHCYAKLYVGLFYNDELVYCMSFGKPRFDKKYEWEIIRSASKLNTKVVGGFSKLFTWFIKNNNGNIISYANKMYSNGNVYVKNGFTLLRSTKINYHYTDKNILYERYGFQKKLLYKKLKKFNPNLSEYENMINNGFRRFWDCGHYVFIYDR